MSILMLLYWVLVIFGALDPDYFSIDFEASADIDTQVPGVDVEQSGQKSANAGQGNESFLYDTLRYFHFDELPLMLILTLCFFCMWLMSINVSYYLGITSPLIGMLLYIPYFIVSLFVVKIFTKPLVYLYKQLNHKGEEAIDFLGRRCRVVNAIGENKIGAVELMVKGDPIKVYAKTTNGEALMAGAEAIIVNESKDKKYYYIEKFDY